MFVEALKLTARPQWDTSALGNDSQTLATTFDGLGEHAQGCDAAKGRWFGVLGRLDAFQFFLAPRPISVIVAVMAIATLVVWTWH